MVLTADTIARVTLILACVLTATLRVLGVKSPAYQAAAHLLVGGLAGAWCVGREKLVLYLACLLTVVEIVCFLRGLYMAN